MKIEIKPAIEESGTTVLTLKAETTEEEKEIKNMFDRCGAVCQCDLDCGRDRLGRFCELKFIVKPQRTLVLTKVGEYEEVFSLLSRSNLLWNTNKCFYGTPLEKGENASYEKQFKKTKH